MREAEFDRFAEQYRQQHASSIRLSGETPDYFARYKIDLVAAAMAAEGRTVRDILDFGGGIGNSVAPMRAAFPRSDLTILDPSRESLRLAEQRFPHQARFQWFDGKTIPCADASYDLAFTACVFHHIPEEEHVSLLREIRRVLRPDGTFFLFEHNPLNPLTLHAVRNCPFDDNAVLIRAAAMRARIAEAGFSTGPARYCVFFPRALARLRMFDRFLTRLPLGAQYYIRAGHDAA